MAPNAPRSFALLQNGVVHEIIRTETAIGDLFHAGLTLIEVTAEIAVGWHWTGSAFLPPVPVAPRLPAPSPLDLLRDEVQALRLRVDARGGA
jgi:hypothetical protein